MRALRERPRWVAAQVLLALALVGLGLIVGSAISGHDGVPQSTVDRLHRAERGAAEARVLRSQAARAQAGARSAAKRADLTAARNRRLRASASVRSNRRLRAALRRTQAALRRARRKKR